MNGVRRKVINLRVSGQKSYSILRQGNESRVSFIIIIPYVCALEITKNMLILCPKR